MCSSGVCIAERAEAASTMPGSISRIGLKSPQILGRESRLAAAAFDRGWFLSIAGSRKLIIRRADPRNRRQTT